MSEHLEEAIPRILGPYRPIVELGKGGMARVFLATVEGHSGLAVVKQLRENLASQPGAIAMFLEEARVATRLAHPNVVRTLGAGEEHGKHFMAMEYLEGVTLSDILSRLGWSGSFTFPMMLCVLADLLAGLDYAHGLTENDGVPLRIVHRDIAPQNVLVTYSGQTKVFDFGVAKVANSAVKTAQGVIKGRVTYMAPEQARGEEIDGRADLYAVGVMLWEMIARRRRWQNLPANLVLARVLAGSPLRPPEAVSFGLPAKLDAIALRAGAPHPTDRYPSAREMRSEILRVLDYMGRPSPAQIGSVVTEAFSGDRTRLRQVVAAYARAGEPQPR